MSSRAGGAPRELELDREAPCARSVFTGTVRKTPGAASGAALRKLRDGTHHQGSPAR